MDFGEANHSIVVTRYQLVAYMDGEGFYVTLLSNSSTSFYPDNTIANFRTKLPQSLQFNVPYEVGLIEIQCPKTWTNFSLKDAEFVVFDKKTNTRSKLRAPLGIYTSIHQIIGEINTCLSAHGIEHTSLHYNTITNRVSVLPISEIELTFQGKLAQMLGFTPGEVFEVIETLEDGIPKDLYTAPHPGFTPGEVFEVFETLEDGIPKDLYTAPHPADVEAGMYNIFVYTDIVEYQTVGDSYVPLLRIVHIDGPDKRIMTRTYDRPHYHRLCKTHIDSIETSLKSDQNQPIPFTYGKTIIKLHFRPVKHHL